MAAPKEVNINAGPDGKAHITLEKGIIQLKDLSFQTFETDDLEAFATFAQAEADDAGVPLAVFYNHERLELRPLDQITSKTRALAVCNMKASEPLALLKKNLGKELTISEFEKLLTALRRHGSFMTTISQLRSLVVSKETKYERQVDNAANFRLLIERKGATGDWTPPATMDFALPVFSFMKDAITVCPDLIMTQRDEDGGAPSFTLELLTFEEDLKDRQREILETALADKLTLPTYWGKASVTMADDAYLYKDNGATL